MADDPEDFDTSRVRACGRTIDMSFSSVVGVLSPLFLRPPHSTLRIPEPDVAVDAKRPRPGRKAFFFRILQPCSCHGTTHSVCFKSKHETRCLLPPSPLEGSNLSDTSQPHKHLQFFPTQNDSEDGPPIERLARAACILAALTSVIRDPHRGTFVS